MTSRPLYLVGSALVLTLGGCWDVASNPAELGGHETLRDTVDGQGGRAALGGASSEGSKQTGAALGGVTGAVAPTTARVTEGGVGTQTGGTSPVGSAAAASGSTRPLVSMRGGGTSRTISSSESRAQGGNSATGATKPASTITSAGGTEPASATTPAGGTAQTGAGGSSGVLESICNDDGGASVPYDYSFGLMGEYAFALSTDCNVGGYALPLVMADPEQLSEVKAFITEATDWYRARILNCSGATTRLGADDYGLLPVSLNDNLSEADCDASLALFLTVIDRHDSQPDAVNPSTKDKIKERIKSVKARAVRSSTAGLTKPLSEPDCIPAESTGAGG